MTQAPSARDTCCQTELWLGNIKLPSFYFRPWLLRSRRVSGKLVSESPNGFVRLTSIDSGSDALRRRLRPIPRQQLVEAVDWMAADAGDHVTQVCLGLDTSSRPRQRAGGRGPAIFRGWRARSHRAGEASIAVGMQPAGEVGGWTVERQHIWTTY